MNITYSSLSSFYSILVTYLHKLIECFSFRLYNIIPDTELEPLSLQAHACEWEAVEYVGCMCDPE